MSISSQDFRSALSLLPSGVCLVTTRTPHGDPVAITISSLTSLSLGPPRILFCLSKSSSTLAFFEASRHFLVHILRGSQQSLADGFANIVPIEWSDVDYETDGDAGLPKIAGCVAVLKCSLATTYDGGDHTIMVGDVNSLDKTPDSHSLSLIRYRRGYHSL